MDDLMVHDEKFFQSLAELDRYMELQFSEGHACLVTVRKHGYVCKVYEWIAEL